MLSKVIHFEITMLVMFFTENIKSSKDLTLDEWFRPAFTYGLGLNNF